MPAFVFHQLGLIMVIMIMKMVVTKVKHGEPKAHLVCLLPARFDGVDHDNGDGGGYQNQSHRNPSHLVLSSASLFGDG